MLTGSPIPTTGGMETRRCVLCFKAFTTPSLKNTNNIGSKSVVSRTCESNENKNGLRESFETSRVILKAASIRELKYKSIITCITYPNGSHKTYARIL